MINIMSYVGMNIQSEVCLWTLLGLMRTIFDATLFKVNANLKQVWQMSMPEELSMPVQRVLRTMISGIMLVQCFTVYVYLASYIVLLYPVFLEERPTLVLPWLLLAAIRNLLCELTSLALGLGTCVLLGTAKPACIRFLIAKITGIMPAFYMWMLVYSYYHVLKVAETFKTFPVVVPPSCRDYGLELAVRRRRTKSLFGEEQLRKKLVAGFYAESPDITAKIPLRNATQSDSSCEETPLGRDTLRLSTASNKYSAEIGAYEDWFGSEINIPRGDRILEQFIVMLLRIGAYLNKDGAESIKSQMFNSALTTTWATRDNIEAMPADVTDTPPLVGNSKGHTASYLREYPQIFMKKLNSDSAQSDLKTNQIMNTQSTSFKNRLSTLSNKSEKSNDITTVEIKNVVDSTLTLSNEKSSRISINNNKLLPILKETRQDSKTDNEMADQLITMKTSDKLVLDNNGSDEMMLSKSNFVSTQILLPTHNEIIKTSSNHTKINEKPVMAMVERKESQNMTSSDEKLKLLKNSLESHSERSVGTCKKVEFNNGDLQECEKIYNDNVENKQEEQGTSTVLSHQSIVSNNKASESLIPDDSSKKGEKK